MHAHTHTEYKILYLQVSALLTAIYKNGHIH